MKIYFLFFILLLNVNAYSQGRNANWVFGDSAGIHFDGMNVPTTFHSTCVSDGESATISDTLGNLLFFCTWYFTIFSTKYKNY